MGTGPLLRGRLFFCKGRGLGFREWRLILVKWMEKEGRGRGLE